MSVTPQSLDQYLERKGSPLSGLGATFVKAGRAFGVDPRLLVAITGAESSFGKHNSGAHNPFGWGPGIDFGSYGEAINAIAKGLRENYIGKGLRTIPAIQKKWAPIAAANDPTGLNSNWTKNVTAFYRELGGKGAAVGAPRAVSGLAAPPAGLGVPGADTGAPAAPALPELDLAPLALGALGGIGSGRKATDTLDDLVMSVAAARRTQPAPAQQQAQAEAAPSPNPPGGGGRVLPLATSLPGRSEFSVVDAEGAPGKDGRRYHAAVDWFAPAGAVVVAPVDGKIVEVKASRGNSGQIFGGVVKVQGRDGKVFVFRHVDPRNGLKVGQQIAANTPVAGVTAWRDGSPHAHVEVWKSLRGGYRMENMLDPLAVFGGDDLSDA